jgi:BolA protein
MPNLHGKSGFSDGQLVGSGFIDQTHDLKRNREEHPVRVADEIRSKLAAGLAPLQLDIVDESHLHAGHSGAPEGGESHFRVAVVSAAFEGVSRVQRQRMVYELLAEELRGPVHALSLTTSTPDETESRNR